MCFSNNWVRSLQTSHHEMLTFCWHNIALSQLTLNADNNIVPASATDGAASQCQPAMASTRGKLRWVRRQWVRTNQYDDDLGMDRSCQSMSWVWSDGWSHSCAIASMGPVATNTGAGGADNAMLVYRWSASQVSAQGDSWHSHENIIQCWQQSEGHPAAWGSSVTNVCYYCHSIGLSHNTSWECSLLFLLSETYPDNYREPQSNDLK